MTAYYTKREQWQARERRLYALIRDGYARNLREARAVDDLLRAWQHRQDAVLRQVGN